MQTAAICEAYGWTYQEYEAQPDWFLALIRERMRIDSKERELQAKKLRRG